MEQQAYILSPPETWYPVRALRVSWRTHADTGDLGFRMSGNLLDISRRNIQHPKSEKNDVI